MSKRSKKRTHSTAFLESTNETTIKSSKLLNPESLLLNPVSILNEALPPGSIVYKILNQTGPPHEPTFHMSCELTAAGIAQLQSECISLSLPLIAYGSGCNKTTAKRDAANALLKLILNNQQQQQQSNLLLPNAQRAQLPEAPAVAQIFIDDEESAVETTTELINKKVSIRQRKQEFADEATRLIVERYKTICQEVDSVFVKYKVLAGIVMTQPLQNNKSIAKYDSQMASFIDSNEIETLTVLCVTSGTKCVSGSSLSAGGDVIHDCHAEILARRCFIHYLLSEMNSLVNNSCYQSSILEQISTVDSQFYRLRQGVEFHLFVSSAPCGDSRIFVLSDNNNAATVAAAGGDHSTRKCRGQLRNKIENGEGAIPTEGKSCIQTWDGILGGERLLTMSCSDKLCLWNCVGIQGSLLSGLLDKPIYFNSVIVGDYFRMDHMTRALYQRAATLPTCLSKKEINAGYGINCPQMMSTTLKNDEIPKKSPDFSVNWILNTNNSEIINTNSGRPADGISRLCKHCLAEKFVKLLFVKKFSKEKNNFPQIENMQFSYAELKRRCSSPAYFVTKKTLFHLFATLQYGAWIGKPFEVEYFSLTCPSSL